MWSSDRIAKSVVPRKQLYPVISTSTTDVKDRLQPISIYPNPADELLLVNIHDQNNAIKKIEIQNSLGQLLLQKVTGQDANQIQISLTGMPTGMYLMKYLMESGEFGRWLRNPGIDQQLIINPKTYTIISGDMKIICIRKDRLEISFPSHQPEIMS